MKPYVITTGVLFGLITLAHILRIIAEGAHVARDPWFMLLTLIAAAFCLWAWRLLRLTSRS